MTWKEHVENTIRQQAADFTALQIAAGRIRPDSIAAMDASSIRNGLSAPEPVAAPTEAQESAAREQDARASHAMNKPASQMDASDKDALRRAIADWARGNSR